MLGRKQIIESLRKARTKSGDGIYITPLIESVLEDQVGDASVDLRLGRWFFAVQQTKTSEIDLASAQEAIAFESREAKSYYIPFHSKFIMHPGRFILASTLEWVRLPSNIGAYITGKSSLGRRGLVIETAAGVHPGFSACLTLELFNCGEVPIAITPGMKIAQLFFHKVQGGGVRGKSQYSGMRKPTLGNWRPEGFLLVDRKALARKVLVRVHAGVPSLKRAVLRKP